VQAAGDWWLDHQEVPRADVVTEVTALIWEGFDGVVAPRPS
jgi:hypothetical protein